MYLGDIKLSALFHLKRNIVLFLRSNRIKGFINDDDENKLLAK